MFTRIGCLRPSVCLLVLLLLASQTDTVSAQGMLVPNRNILKINRALKKVLNAELHFVKKICNPTDEQFAEIHRAGLDEVNELAQLCDSAASPHENARHLGSKRTHFLGSERCRESSNS